MLKIIRMSKIPVWYSEGFNPHPYITFARPLSLGFESDYEIMDIRLDDDSFKNEEVYNSLKPLFPEGLKLFSCEDPVMKAGQVAYADYKIEFDSVPDGYMSGLEQLLNNDAIIAKKKTKKGTYKDIDLKEFVPAIESDAPTKRAAKILGSLICQTIVLTVDETVNCGNIGLNIVFNYNYFFK